MHHTRASLQLKTGISILQGAAGRPRAGGCCRTLLPLLPASMGQLYVPAQRANKSTHGQTQLLKRQACLRSRRCRAPCSFALPLRGAAAGARRAPCRALAQQHAHATPHGRVWGLGVGF